MHRRIFFILSAALCSSCVSSIKPDTSPVLHENEKFRSVSEAERERVRFDCMSTADRVVIADDPYNMMARRAAIGAVVGSATGSISGAIFSDVDQGVASGAAVGTLVGFLQSLIDISRRTPSYERFVENCLNKEGYEVVGWRSPDEE